MVVVVVAGVVVMMTKDGDDDVSDEDISNRGNGVDRIQDSGRRLLGCDLDATRKIFMKVYLRFSVFLIRALKIICYFTPASRGWMRF